MTTNSTTGTSVATRSLGEYDATVPARPASAGARPDAVNPGVVTAALLNAIDRLEDALQTESSLLRGGRGTASLEEFNYRKSHGLLELTRAARGLDPESLDAGVRQRLLGLRHELENNRLLLKTHLDAAREISGILTTAMRQADSDGTYSAPANAGGTK